MAEAMEKIFFLHIPKTAGTAFNEIFKSVVPSGRYFEHMESSRKRFDEVINDGYPFYASGHFSFEATRQLALRPDVFSMTILRDPTEQLISHLKWVKAYGNPARPDRRSQIPEAIARLSLDLWNTDLNDVGRLAQVLDNPTSLKLFDNLQTRYLTRSVTEPVNADQLDKARQNFRKFDFIFVVDDMTLAVSRLSNMFTNIGKMPFINSALLNDKVDLNDNRVFDFYRSFLKYDAPLYAEIRKYAWETYFRDTEAGHSADEPRVL